MLEIRFCDQEAQRICIQQTIDRLEITIKIIESCMKKQHERYSDVKRTGSIAIKDHSLLLFHVYFPVSLLLSVRHTIDGDTS